jgi:hypothetical protein
MLRSVVARAMEHGRPLLVASAQRDLAALLVRDGDFAAAAQMAETARATFRRLGAKVEIRKLDALLERYPSPPIAIRPFDAVEPEVPATLPPEALGRRPRGGARRRDATQ